MTPWTSAGLSLLGEADGQEPNDAIEHAWRASSVQGSRGVEGRFRGRDARVDEHSAGPRLHRHRRHPHRHRPLPVLLPLVAFAVLGSSRHLVVAADSATAAILSSSLSRMAPLASEKYLALVGMLTLLTAGLLLLARVFKLGFLADFLSRTVLVGFLTGVGIRSASRCSVACSASTSFRAARLGSSGRSCAGRRRLPRRRQPCRSSSWRASSSAAGSRRGFRFRWWLLSGRLPLAHGFTCRNTASP